MAEAHIRALRSCCNHTVVPLLGHVHNLVRDCVRHNQPDLTEDSLEGPVQERNPALDDKLSVEAPDNHAAVAWVLEEVVRSRNQVVAEGMQR